MKRIAILQSSYIPWRGVFDFIDRVDEFVVYDDVQFIKRHWHNRNRIKTADGTKWLTIPVESKGKYYQNIDEVRIAGEWAESHWRSIRHAYGKAPFFDRFGPQVEDWFGHVGTLELLTDVNVFLLNGCKSLLGLETPLTRSADYPAEGQKTDRLLSICRAAGATHYISGPAARAYMEEDKFAEAGIALEWMDYGGYQPYPQLHGEFDGQVSLLDMIFNIGPQETLAKIRAER